jgi:alpha-tubulin suppressor-like RCC1 family protein
MTDIGHVYAWGVNEEGVLGFHSQSLEEAHVNEPKCVESLRGVHAIVAVTAGSRHSMVLTG